MNRNLMIFTLFVLILIVFASTGYAQNGELSSGREINLVERQGEVRNYTNGFTAGLNTNRQDVQRYGEVTLSSYLTTEQNALKGDRVKLNLFEETDFYAVVDRVNLNVNGSYTIRGRIEGYDFGSLMISTTDERTLCVIDIPEKGKEYEISFDSSSRSHQLYEIDYKKKDMIEKYIPLIEDDDSERNTFEQARIKQTIKVQQKNGGGRPGNDADIDIMVVYTPAAKKWADLYASGIENSIAIAIEKGQYAFDNSETMINFNLVFSAEVDYDESSTASNHLYRLQGKEDGYMDEIHEWRRISGADEITLLAPLDDAGGIGFLLNTPQGSPSTAMNVVRVQQAHNSYTLVHEVGHNMGLGHAASQNYQPGPGLSSYSSGWRWAGNDGGYYCSVMTYEPGAYFEDGIDHQRVGHFSSPLITHKGGITGHAEKGDNRRTLIETKHIVAAYSLPEAEASSIEGYVYLEGTELPVDRARIEFVGIDYPLYTDEEGYFFAYALPADTVNIVVSKEDYHSVNIDEFELEQGAITPIIIEIEKFHRMNVSGHISTTDYPEEGLYGATVTLSGIEEFTTTTDEEGYFEFIEVRSNFSYELKVVAEGYVVYEDMLSIEHYSEDIELERIVLYEIAYPTYGVSANLSPDNTASISWGRPFGYFDTMRRDNGIYSDRLGLTSGTNYTVFGTVFTGNHLLYEVSWYLSDEIESHSTVNIFIFGLDENGNPDSDALLFQELEVANRDNRWNYFALPHSIETTNGFLFGLSYQGNISLGLDDGLDEEYPFEAGTQYLAVDYRNNNWRDTSATGIEKNLMLRTKGYHYETQGHSDNCVRSLERYVVYRSLIEEGIDVEFEEIGRTDQTSFADNDWDSLLNGDYRYAIKAEYTNQVLSIPSFSNAVSYTEVISVVDALSLEYSDSEKCVQLSWEWTPGETDPDGSTDRAFEGFTVLRNENILAEEVAETNYTDYDLPAGLLAYKVTAKHTNGYSNELEAFYFSTLGPTDLIAELLGDGTVELSWEAPFIEDKEGSQFKGYSVYRNDELLNENPVEDCFYLDTETLVSEEYSYYVTVKYGGEQSSDPSNRVEVMVTKGANETLLPLSTELKGNYPNPFNPETTIFYSLKEGTPLSLKIYNIKGRLVKTLVDDVSSAGTYSVVWDGRDSEGKSVGSGVYFYRMETPNYSSIKRMVLIK
ncbi:MAG: T9SS type A sorting domain-containing protein [Candidatus Cloacimonas sp.]|nr:T9SS type A sorting domain-containing protein [Candidatus Cloacimonadota bacterium]